MLSIQAAEMVFKIKDQRSKDVFLSSGNRRCLLLWHVFTHIYIYTCRSESPLDNGIQYFWKIYVYIYTFVTFVFSDMCIEIIILEYKDLEFDFPLKGQLKCGIFYLLQDVCNCNYISE